MFERWLEIVLVLIVQIGALFGVDTVHVQSTLYYLVKSLGYSITVGMG